jgi:hypothetical protein
VTNESVHGVQVPVPASAATVLPVHETHAVLPELGTLPAGQTDSCPFEKMDPTGIVPHDMWSVVTSAPVQGVQAADPASGATVLPVHVTQAVLPVLLVEPAGHWVIWPFE